MPNASLLAKGITVTHGRATILDAVDLTAAPGHRVGLIGSNGVGKTTLLRVLVGQLKPDSGTVRLAPASASVGYLAQEPDRRPGETARAYVGRRTGVAAADRELEAATAGLAAGGPGVDERYGQALDRWMALGAADLDTRTEQVWDSLALPQRLLDQDTTTLSGGEAARAGLAALLLSRFDVLLLDEPTNDLDLASLDRLERFVVSQTSALVLVSHDRAFLEATVTEVVEIDEHRRRASRFGGGWAAYQAERTLARQHAEEDYADYTTKRDQLKGRAQREREWMTQGVAKAKRKQPDNDKALRKAKAETTEQLAARASRSERAIERLEVVDKPWEGWQLRFAIAAAPRSGTRVASLVGAVVERGAFRLGPVSLDVAWAERVAIVGANGSGKTTLLGALLGRLPLAAGTSWVGPGVVVGEIDQARRTFEGDAPLLDAFMAATGMTVAEARTLLAKFSLAAGHVVRPARSVSPGERTRAALALLQARGVNCLVLDEPTNHLDLAAIEQLEAGLDGFEGTVLLVTHDRRLLESVRLTRRIAVADGAIVADDAV